MPTGKAEGRESEVGPNAPIVVGPECDIFNLNGQPLQHSGQPLQHSGQHTAPIRGQLLVNIRRGQQLASLEGSGSSTTEEPSGRHLA